MPINASLLDSATEPIVVVLSVCVGSYFAAKRPTRVAIKTKLCAAIIAVTAQLPHMFGCFLSRCFIVIVGNAATRA